MSELILKAPFDNHFMVDLPDETDPLSTQLLVILQQSQAELVKIDGQLVKYEGKYVLYVYGNHAQEVPVYLTRLKFLKSWERFSGKDPVVLSLPEEGGENEQIPQETSSN